MGEWGLASKKRVRRLGERFRTSTIDALTARGGGSSGPNWGVARAFGLPGRHREHKPPRRSKPPKSSALCSICVVQELHILLDALLVGRAKRRARRKRAHTEPAARAWGLAALTTPSKLTYGPQSAAASAPGSARGICGGTGTLAPAARSRCRPGRSIFDGVGGGGDAMRAFSLFLSALAPRLHVSRRPRTSIERHSPSRPPPPRLSSWAASPSLAARERDVRSPPRCAPRASPSFFLRGCVVRAGI